jgi:hypothetical protein
MNEKECAGENSCQNVRYYSDIFLKRLRKTTKKPWSAHLLSQPRFEAGTLEALLLL